jgi:hypothetical protein
MKKFFAFIAAALLMAAPVATIAQELQAAKECHIVIEDEIKIGFVGNLLIVTYHTNTYEVCTDGSKTLVKDPHQ